MKTESLIAERTNKGKQALAILQKYLNKKDKKNLTVLDAGCGYGAISYLLAQEFRQVIGIDIDSKALKEARKRFRRSNLQFIYMDAAKMSFPKDSFDIVVCYQVYQYIKNQPRLFNLINNVLKPGGICLFAGINKLAFFKKKEKQKVYVRTYRELLELCQKFTVQKYTSEIVKDPEKFSFNQYKQLGRLLKVLPIIFWQRMEFLMPSFFWILKKP